jgi:GYF domain 2
MEQAPQESWFYTQKGQRHGPISFEQLKAMVKQSDLDPLADMVWKHGLPSWKPLGEVMSMFSDPIASVPSASATATKPAEAPKPTPQPTQSLKETPKPIDTSKPAPNQTDAPKETPPKKKSKMIETVQFSKSPASAKDLQTPGVYRPSYFIFAILLPLLISGGLPFLLPLAGAAISPQIGGLITLAASLILIAVGIIFTLMRLTNLSMSRWWYLASFVPILNLWLGYRCFACPAGYAEHGKMDRAGIVLAFLYWLILIIIVVGMVFGMMVFYNLIANDPEFKDQLRQLIQQNSGAANPK